ncbi:Nse4 C-terminal-domain-containing protein [Lentinula novae-zelandiae]|nr:Nse4 C-terminal-domain-containing protein [Lentinula novae-zelandiae]
MDLSQIPDGAQGGQNAEEEEAKRAQEEQMRRDMMATVLDNGARERSFDHKGKQRAGELAEVRLETANVLFELGRFGLFKDTPEAILDSDVVLTISSKSAQLTRQLKFGSGVFDFDEYVSRLVTFMDGRRVELEFVEHIIDNEDDPEMVEPLKWERIGKLALKKTRRIPAVGFMSGPISLEKPRTRTKSARFKKNKADERKPQAVTAEDLQRSTNETTRNVITIHAILENIGPTNLFQLIINPVSFAQSVENLFYLSFLIKEGKVGLSFEKDKEPIVHIVLDEDSDQSQTRTYENQSQSRQLVFELDMATWKHAIEVFGISESVIPHREPYQTRMGRKWYG